MLGAVLKRRSHDDNQSTNEPGFEQRRRGWTRRCAGPSKELRPTTQERVVCVEKRRRIFVCICE